MREPSTDSQPERAAPPAARQPSRIVVFAPDMPYPPNRGGRADIWRRIEAFRQLGHEVMLVNLQEPSGPHAPTAAVFAHVDSVVNARYSYAIKRSPLITARQLALSWLVPWHAANRMPGKQDKRALLERMDRFAPDLLWLDGPWFGLLGRELAQRYGVPLLYRSHNIEHRYIRSQARAAVKWRDRLAWRLACIGLKRFETDTIGRADLVFDISVSDLAYWQGVGMRNMHWLPPLPELAFKPRPDSVVDGDLVFIGNLGTPNNVRGVEWLLTEVLPRVRRSVPDVRCRIVGSNPTPFIAALLKSAAGVELCANVPDPTPYLFGARVLVNPVMTGSGVQVKMLDMLMTDAPIVTAAQGTRGLPTEFAALVRVADDPDAFAAAICEELAAPSLDLAARVAARAVFSVAAIAVALDLTTGNKDAHDHP